MPRRQQSRRARRTTGSPRLIGSHAVEAGGIRRAIAFPIASDPSDQTESNRPASADRTLASRGKRWSAPRIAPTVGLDRCLRTTVPVLA